MDRKKIAFGIQFLSVHVVILGSPATHFQCSRDKQEEMRCTQRHYHDCTPCDNQTPSSVQTYMNELPPYLRREKSVPWGWDIGKEMDISRGKVQGKSAQGC